MFDNKQIQTLILSDEQTFFRLLEEFTKKILAQQKTEPIWISEKESMQLLGVSSKTTLWKYRSQGVIEYSQIGKKIILYKRTSILEFIESHACKTF